MPLSPMIWSLNQNIITKAVKYALIYEKLLQRWWSDLRLLAAISVYGMANL